jgi:hypothetical protein
VSKFETQEPPYCGIVVAIHSFLMDYWLEPLLDRKPKRKEACPAESYGRSMLSTFSTKQEETNKMSNEIAIISVIISLICLAVSLRDGVPSRDQVRRFLKLMVTGKYEEPKER